MQLLIIGPKEPSFFFQALETGINIGFELGAKPGSVAVIPPGRLSDIGERTPTKLNRLAHGRAEAEL